MEKKKSRRKFLGVSVPGTWNLKRADTSTSRATDDEQDSAPSTSSRIRSAAASSHQTDEPDPVSVLDANPPTVIPIESQPEPELASQPNPEEPPQTDVVFVSTSRSQPPEATDSPSAPLREPLDAQVASTPTADPGTIPRDRNSGLWGKAYKNLRLKATEVVIHYERHIPYIVDALVDPLSTPEYSQEDMVALSNQVIRGWLKGWIEEQGTHDEKRPGEVTLELISINEAAQRSLKWDPDAAIAWGTLPTIIQAIENTTSPSENVIYILKYIIARLEWYCALACLAQLENEGNSDVVTVETGQRDMIGRIVELYEAILGVLLSVACVDSYSSSPSDLDLETFYSAEKGLPLSEIYRVEHLFTKIPYRPEETDARPIHDAEVRSGKDTHDDPVECFHKAHVSDPSQFVLELEEGRAEIFSSALATACKSSEFASLFSETSDLVEALCVHGSPGTGKTMLLMGVIWNLAHQKSESMFKGHVSCFICSDRSAKSGTTILKSMIWQVIRKQPKLCHHLNEQFRLTERDDFDDPEDLLALSFVFFRIVSDLDFEPTFFVIESFDQGAIGNDFLALISTSIELSSARTRWLISVDESSITSIRDGAPLLHFRYMSLNLHEAGCLVSPIEYASFLVKQLPKNINLCDDTCEALAALLCNNSNSNYLWMDLACHAIAAADPWNARELLESLPREIEDLWIDRKDRIERLDWNTPDYCAQVLDVMAIVYRPLHLTELADLVSIPAGVFLRGVVEKCVSLLEVRKNMVFFTCVAAKAFLRKTTSPSPIGHAQMAQKCLDSISKINNPVPEDAPESGHYASVYWMNHLAERDDTKWLDSTIDSVLKFAQNKTVEWIDRLVEDECLGHALTQARNLECVLIEESNQVEGGAALIQAIQDIHQLLAVCASEMIDSDDPGVPFYPSQDVMNQHLRQGGYPTLTVPLPQRDRSLVHALKGHTDWIRSCAFSPDAQLIASASDDYTVRIWNAQTGKMQHVFDGFNSWIYSIAWSPGVDNLIAATYGDKVSILDLATGQQKDILDSGSQHRVKSLAFSADGLKLAAATGPHIAIWNIPSFDRMTFTAVADDNDSVEHVEFSMDNNLLLSISLSRATLWDLENGEATRKVDIDEESSLYAGTVSPDGKYVAVATESSLRLRSTTDQSAWGEPLSTSAPTSALAFSYDGKHLAVASEDGDIKIFDPWTDRSVQTLKGHSRPVYKVSFSNTGQHLISCSSDRTLRVWRIESETPGQRANHEEGHLQPITCLELSPDGNILVSASEDQTLCLWDGRNGTFKSKREHDDTAALALQFSGDGNRLITGARDGCVRLWDISDGTFIFVDRFDGHIDWVRSVMFAPDESLIASGSDDKNVILWNVADRIADPIVLDTHEDYVRSVAFSPDGTLLASGGDDRRVVIWDTKASEHAQKGHYLRILREASAMVAAVAFTSDGSQLVASLFDSKIAIWDTETWSYMTIEASNVCRSLRIIPDENHWLETDVGTISLRPDARKGDLPRQCLWGISREDWWITYEGEKRVFFLPEAYEPDADEKSTLVREGRVVIGCMSGQVLLLNFEQ